MIFLIISQLLTHTNYIWSDKKNDGLQLIDGGEDKYGTKLYICRVVYKDTYVGGKLLNNYCYFPWGGQELKSGFYQALKRKSWVHLTHLMNQKFIGF